jgi:hypothetical protein
MANQKLTSVIICIILILLVASCTQHSEKSSHVTAETQQLAARFYEGEHTFKEYCISCHFPPDRNAKDKYLFDNIFDRLPSPSEVYFAKYIKIAKQ